LLTAAAGFLFHFGAGNIYEMSEISDETPVEKVEDTEIETEEDKLMGLSLLFNCSSGSILSFTYRL